MSIIKVTLVVAVLVLTGCRDAVSEYNWAVKFCGGESEVYQFNLMEYHPSTVRCRDGRYVDIPEGV